MAIDDLVFLEPGYIAKFVSTIAINYGRDLLCSKNVFSFIKKIKQILFLNYYYVKYVETILKNTVSISLNFSNTQHLQ
jgi:hypothetical protein